MRLGLIEKHEGGLVFESGDPLKELKDRVGRVVQFSEVFADQSRHDFGES
jgi:hypothetical protein